MIFTRDFVTRENHWQIASLVTQKSLFTVTHALFFISYMCQLFWCLMQYLVILDHCYIDGFVQEIRNCSALAMEFHIDGLVQERRKGSWLDCGIYKLCFIWLNLYSKTRVGGAVSCCFFFLWWVPSAKKRDHHGVSSGWSSTWFHSNTGLSSPFWLTPFFFWSIKFWWVNG